ncbi:MAG: hypothetical protein H6618_07365 [Deltaproteobacteria bacterium]|nr:hypothetical protein [Deltaproteobacteria bacterium]
MKTEKDRYKHRSTSFNTLDLSKFRKKKTEKEWLARGREPLYVSYSRGQLHGSDSVSVSGLSDFGGRIADLKSELEKINALMNRSHPSS